MNQETKVGLFLLVAIAAILTSILFLGKVRLFNRSHTYFVEFDNVEALPPKAAVKIAGVEIGKVDEVKLVNGRARIAIDINRDIVLHRDCVIRIGSTGIIGTRFVEISPGTSATEELNPGDTIQGSSGHSLEAMMAKVSALFEDDENGNAITNLKASIAHIKNVTAALDDAMGKRSQDLSEIVSNIRDLTRSAKVFAGHLEEISTEHKEDVKVALAKFRDIGEKLDSIVTKIDSGKGTIGALVSDDKTATEVKEAIADVKTTAASAKKALGRLSETNVYWNFRYRYDTRDDESRADLGLTIVPRPGKYYSLGVTNLGEVPENEKNTKYERRNRFTATMGADLGPFTGYAGAISSRGGAGINFRPFFMFPKWNKRIELNGEARYFSRDDVINGEHLKGTIVSAGLHVALNRWWWIGVRQQDIFEHSAFEVFSNVIFRDEDLSYLLGLASLARP